MSSAVRQLIVSAGLAAANHGLHREMSTIQGALDALIDEPGVRRIVEATLLLGSGQTAAAHRLLQPDSSAEAQLLRRLMDSERHPVF